VVLFLRRAMFSCVVVFTVLYTVMYCFYLRLF